LAAFENEDPCGKTTQGIKHQENAVIPRPVRGIQRQKNWILWSSQRMTLQGNPVARPQGIYKLKEVISKNQ